MLRMAGSLSRRTARYSGASSVNFASQSFRIVSKSGVSTISGGGNWDRSMTSQLMNDLQ
nr:MAG TPA: hypothetical protein [Caudoviricetes sp.]